MLDKAGYSYDSNKMFIFLTLWYENVLIFACNVIFLHSGGFSLQKKYVFFHVILWNHHPSLEFDCGEALLIIIRVCVCLFVRVHACALCIWAHASSLPASTMALRGGGGATLQRCNEINDPCFFRCDQQTKLSSRSETKGVTAGGGGGGNWKHSAPELWRFQRTCASVALSGVSRQTSYINIHTVHLCPTPPLHPLLTFRLKPSAKCCQPLTSVPKMNCIPEPSESRIHL